MDFASSRRARARSNAQIQSDLRNRTDQYLRRFCRLVATRSTHLYERRNQTRRRVVLGSALQILLFIQGPYFQGLVRLIPVGVFGLLFTVLALWRKSLRPGLIAHGLGMKTRARPSFGEGPTSVNANWD